MDSLFGIKHNVALLSADAFDLSPTEVKLIPLTAAEVVGKESRVCVVLASDVPGKGSDKEVERLLNGAKLSATVATNSDVIHNFKCQGSGWAMSGRIVPKNEITACVQPSCAKRAISIGSKVLSVAISSTAPVHALGAYWDSTAAFDRAGD